MTSVGEERKLQPLDCLHLSVGILRSFSWHAFLQHGREGREDRKEEEREKLDCMKPKCSTTFLVIFGHPGTIFFFSWHFLHHWWWFQIVQISFSSPSQLVFNDRS